MSPRVCICCGESMVESAQGLSRNPNLCASCSSLADGMDDSDVLVLTRKSSTEVRNTRATMGARKDTGGELLIL